MAKDRFGFTVSAPPRNQLSCKWIAPPLALYDKRNKHTFTANQSYEKSAIHFEPFVKLYPSFLVRYSVATSKFPKRNKENDIQMPTTNKSKGLLSEKSQGRLKRIINLLVALSTFKPLYSKANKKWYSFKLGLLTLTLSSEQTHTDDEIKRLLLQPMLRRLRTIYNVRNYVWKAEAQDRGAIHFHITIDKYIDKYAIRNDWNLIQDNLGYVERSGIASPNSTDIHGIKSVNDLAAYMATYLSKKDRYTSKLKEEIEIEKKRVKEMNCIACELPNDYFNRFKRRIAGKLWDCNNELKQFSIKLHDISEVAREATGIANEKDSKVIDEGYYSLILSTTKRIAQSKLFNGIISDYLLKLYN